MHYTILDLEWDSAYNTSQHRYINQILQIGAVKLDEGLNPIDTFEVTVRSSFSKKVSGRFSRLTGITTEKMRNGIPFAEAVERYNNWAGEDTVTMTWSTSDLFAIAENECLLPKEIKFNIGKYVDIQKYIQKELSAKGYSSPNQIALSHAVELAEISTDDFTFHTALDDSMACAAILRKLYNAERFENSVHDTAKPEFYERLFFKPYYLNDINDPLIKRSELEFHCEKCGKKLRRLSCWKYKNRSFTARFFCDNCREELAGRVSFKKSYDSLAVKRSLYIPRKEQTDDDMQPVPEKMS